MIEFLVGIVLAFTLIAVIERFRKRQGAVILFFGCGMAIGLGVVAAKALLKLLA